MNHFMRSQFSNKMSMLDQFDCEDEEWYDYERHCLRSEYEFTTLSITELAHLHRRKPESVARFLQSLGYVKDIIQVRGYEEYRNSDLYKVIHFSDNTEKESVEVDLRNEITKLKKIIKELLIVLNRNKIEPAPSPKKDD